VGAGQRVGDEAVDVAGVEVLGGLFLGGDVLLS